MDPIESGQTFEVEQGGERIKILVDRVDAYGVHYQIEGNIGRLSLDETVFRAMYLPADPIRGGGKPPSKAR